MTPLGGHVFPWEFKGQASPCGSTCGIAGGIPRSRKFVSVRRNISAEALPHGASWRSVFCLRTRFVRISAAPRSTVQTTERRAVVQTSAHIRLPPRRFRCCYESGVTGPGSDHGRESIGSGRRNPSPARFLSSCSSRCGSCARCL
jgi:hypothetical protein